MGEDNGTHSSTLAWKIPWTEEPGRLQSMGSRSQIRLSDFTFTFHFHTLEKEMATHSSVLVWRIPGTGEPGGLPSMGSHRVGHDWSDLAAAANGKAVEIAGVDYFSKELGAQVKENDKDFSGGAREDQDKLCNINKRKLCLSLKVACWWRGMLEDEAAQMCYKNKSKWYKYQFIQEQRKF